MPKNPGSGTPGEKPAGDSPFWRTHWQAPALVLAVLLLIGGVITTILTSPKPNITRMLEEADQLIAADRFQPALDVLNKKLLPYFDAGSLNGEQRKQFHLLRARGLYLAQQAIGIDLEENARNIDAEYTEATQAGGVLEPKDTFYFANANVVLGKYPRAIDLAHALPPEARADKGKVIKRVVEALLAAPEFDSETTLRLLAEFLAERELTISDRGWALARQAELLMRQGLMASAITKMLQTMPSLMNDLDRDQLGELYLLLGKAYFETDALGEAAKQLGLAAKLLLPSDAKHAQAMVMLAHIDEQMGDPPEEGKTQAKQKYADIAERFASSETRLPALLGLGEVNAAMGNIAESLAAYTELVRDLAAGKRHPDLTIAGVTESLMSRSEARFDAGRMDQSLDYAALAERLYTAETVPPQVLLVIARNHRHAAEDLFQGSDPGAARLLELSRLDPATREQVRQHLVASGRYYKKHADAVGINDNAAYGRSLWMAADCFDQAGDSEQAIPLFSDYAKFFPGERQRPEAMYRLARAYQSRGDYTMAEQGYRQLIDEGQSGKSMVGPFGDMSHVPLAQCYLVDGDKGNDEEAESLLTRVVEGHAGGTTTPQFRDALLELGRLKASHGQYAAAIQLLDEAANRFPESAQIDGVRFELAEAYRQDARAIQKTLLEAMPEARRQSLTTARVERLSRSAALYEEVRQSLEAKDARRLSKLDLLQLRNSYFYLADCEFELRNFDAAIRHYDAARERYATDPASLVAMVQIVNAYVEQGDMQRAATANTRAKRFYDSLPASVWSDPNLPMGRKEWEAWLNSMSSLKGLTPAAASASGHE